MKTYSVYQVDINQESNSSQAGRLYVASRDIGYHRLIARPPAAAHRTTPPAARRISSSATVFNELRHSIAGTRPFDT